MTTLARIATMIVPEVAKTADTTVREVTTPGDNVIVKETVRETEKETETNVVIAETIATVEVVEAIATQVPTRSPLERAANAMMIELY